MTTPFTPLDGGCTCGQVRFRIASAPIITHCCHCRTCQKASGSAFRINAMIETERLEVLQGEPRRVEDAGGKSLRCPACGDAVWSYLPMFGEAIAFVGVGLLDEGERLPPEAHYFIRSKHPWVTLPANVPAFETLGHPDKPEARARVEAVLARAAASPA